MKTIEPRIVIEALNELVPTSAPDLTNPSGSYSNYFNIKNLGGRIHWSGLGGIGKERNIYPPEKLIYIRHTVYRNMPLASYMNDEQLLHHYFCYLTPSNLIADAATQIVTLGGTRILHAINLN